MILISAILAAVVSVVPASQPVEPAQQLDGLQGWVWDQVGADVLTPEQAKRLWALHAQAVASAVQDCQDHEPWWKSQEAFLALLAAVTGLFELRVRKKVHDTETKIHKERDRGKDDRYYEAVLKKAKQEQQKTSNKGDSPGDSVSVPDWLR